MLKKLAETNLPTDWGNFNMFAFGKKEACWMPHLALVHEKTEINTPVLVRIHSECITGDLFHSRKCDCGEQLHEAMHLIQQSGGILIYLRQEGRGIGIVNKLKAYKLQEKGFNTIEANEALGLAVDARKFDIAVDMLKQLEVSTIKLITNNPEKIKAFEGSEINVIERVALEPTINQSNKGYLSVKKNSLGHLLEMR